MVRFLNAVFKAAVMKSKIEALLKFILLLVVLYTSSIVSFAGTKKSNRKKTPVKQSSTTSAATVSRAPRLSDAPAQSGAGTGDSIKNPMTPKLKRRHRVAIVPAPPPGQIPVYIPPKQ